LSGPNSVGILVAVDSPEPFGPRNLDHSVVAASDAPASTTTPMVVKTLIWRTYKVYVKFRHRDV
jgi:hypothetical protein